VRGKSHQAGDKSHQMGDKSHQVEDKSHQTGDKSHQVGGKSHQTEDGKISLAIFILIISMLKMSPKPLRVHYLLVLLTCKGY
jgi:hypothetical protein